MIGNSRIIHKLCHFLPIALIALSFEITVYAQNRYSSNTIREMAEAMHMSETFDTLRDGYYVNEYSWNGLPLTLFVEDSEVIHLGYSLFLFNIQNMNMAPAFRFMEQYVLACDLPIKRQISIASEMESKGFVFEYGNVRIIKQLIEDTAVIVNIGMIDGKRYHLTWVRNDSVVCSVSFPIDYCLLHGTTLLENEERLLSDFLRLEERQQASVEKCIISPLDLIKVSDTNIFILQGDSIYVSELNNNQYYRIEDSVFKPIFSSSMPRESFSNLIVSNHIANNYTLIIKLMRYGYKSSTATMPFSNLMVYFNKKGCTPYFGILEKTDSTMRGLLLLVNIPEGYCHTIRLDIETNSMDTGAGIIQGRMMPYIPISKIKKLFQ